MHLNISSYIPEYTLMLQINLLGHKQEFILYFFIFKSILIKTTIVIWDNVAAYHPVGPGSNHDRVNFLVEISSGFSFNHKTNVRKSGPHSSPVIIQPESAFFGFNDKCEMCLKVVGGNDYIFYIICKCRSTVILSRIFAKFRHFCEILIFAIKQNFLFFNDFYIYFSLS